MRAAFALLALAACGAPRPADILLYTGPGTSKGDVTAVEAILDNKHLDYSTASAHQLNRMDESQLGAFRLLIIPGGNFLEISAELTPSTTTAIHNAVQGGLNYLGICAGAFLAGHAIYNSLGLADEQFGFYSAEKSGMHKAIVSVTSVGTPAIEQYWEDGPELTGWGSVVGKYPDGTPAIVEGTSGKGWVILVGTHPEAPERWRRGMTFTTPASVANAYAGVLVEAAMKGEGVGVVLNR